MILLACLSSARLIFLAEKSSISLSYPTLNKSEKEQHCLMETALDLESKELGSLSCSAPDLPHDLGKFTSPGHDHLFCPSPVFGLKQGQKPFLTIYRI